MGPLGGIGRRWGQSLQGRKREGREEGSLVAKLESFLGDLELRAGGSLRDQRAEWPERSIQQDQVDCQMFGV